MQQTETIFFGTVFIAGLLSFFSPCVLPLLPVYFGILTGDDEGAQHKLYPLIKTLSFIAGLSVVFILLGFGAGALGGLINHPATTYIMGAIVILLGIHQMEIIHIPLLMRQKTIAVGNRSKKGLIGAFILGLSFSFGWTPCIGPVLSSVLAVAAGQGAGVWQGGILMAFYTLGLAIPFCVLALLSTWALQHVRKLNKHLLLLKRIGGALIVLIGVMLILGQLNWFTTLWS